MRWGNCILEAECGDFVGEREMVEFEKDAIGPDIEGGGNEGMEYESPPPKC